MTLNKQMPHVESLRNVILEERLTKPDLINQLV